MQSDTPPPAKSTAYLVAVGTAIFMGMRWALRFIGLISTIVLARLLVPDDFGLVAIAVSYIGLIDGITDIAIRNSVIRHGGDDRAFLDTVFTVQVIRGLAVSLVVLGSSFILPAMIGDERLTPIIWFMALGTVWGSFLNPHLALFERDLDFRRESILQISAKVLSTVTAIVVAVIFRNYWALIAGTLVGSLAKVILSYVLSPFMPRFSLKRWRELLSFAGWLSASQTLERLGHSLDNIVIGAFAGIRAAGLYNVGSSLAGLPLDEFLPVLTRTLFPGLLRFKDDVPKLRQNTLNAVEVICTFAFPVAVGFAFVAPEAVLILYGPKWMEAVPIVQAISLCVGIESIGASVTTSLAMATGRTKFLFRRSVVRSALRIPTFILGAWFYGIPGAIVGYFIGSVLFASANVGILKVILETTYVELASRIWRALAAVAVMTAVLIVVDQNLAATSDAWVAAYVLGLKMASGTIAYGLVRLSIWRLTGRPEFTETVAMTLLSAVATRLQLQK